MRQIRSVLKEYYNRKGGRKLKLDRLAGSSSASAVTGSGSSGGNGGSSGGNNTGGSGGNGGRGSSSGSGSGGRGSSSRSGSRGGSSSSAQAGGRQKARAAAHGSAGARAAAPAAAPAAALSAQPSAAEWAPSEWAQGARVQAALARATGVPTLPPLRLGRLKDEEKRKLVPLELSAAARKTRQEESVSRSCLWVVYLGGGAYQMPPGAAAGTSWEEVHTTRHRVLQLAQHQALRWVAVLLPSETSVPRITRRLDS